MLTVSHRSDALITWCMHSSDGCIPSRCLPALLHAFKRRTAAYSPRFVRCRNCLC